MNYISTQDINEIVSFKDAVINGLAKNKALFMPEFIPTLPIDFFQNIEGFNNNEIAYEVLLPFVKDSIDESILRNIIAETLSFPTPVVHIRDNIYVLELFHGPTKAFKDVGARFMSRCMSNFVKNGREVTILVATSGDTGSAVANGFFDVEGINVVILFPKSKVSQFQEHQMTSLGKNIFAVEVEGTFDDCQSLVKQAFVDIELNKTINLSSANSINIARLLPQMLYYFFAYKQLKKYNQPIVVSVPSGNFGNLTAGIIAKKMGLPIERFIAATNSNNTFPKYISSGIYTPKPSVSTYSNAMDVGAPSNFERLMFIYNNDLTKIQKDIVSESIGDIATLEQIKNTHLRNNYILDPHGAVGKICLINNLRSNEIGVFLETAHPKKFESVVQKAINNFPSNEVNMDNCKKVSISNSYKELVNILQK
ncbi:MAG: threonine synthase [Saprospiraceae bacterium]|nr:threonine synthase [Saprospiraceae bacterium]